MGHCFIKLSRKIKIIQVSKFILTIDVYGGEIKNAGILVTFQAMEDFMLVCRFYPHVSFTHAVIMLVYGDFNIRSPSVTAVCFSAE